MLIITLNISGLIPKLKDGYHHTELKSKSKHLKHKDTARLKVKGWKKYIMQATIQKKVEVALFILKQFAEQAILPE